MGRRWRALLALLAVVLAGAPTTQAEGPTYGPDQLRMWRLHRTVPVSKQQRNEQLQVGFRYSGADFRSVIVMAPGEPRRGGWKWHDMLGHVGTTVLEWNYSPAYPFVFASVGGVRVSSPDCPDRSLCKAGDGPFERTWPVAVQPGREVIVAALNIDAEVISVPRGWRISRIPDPRAVGGDMQLVQSWQTPRSTGVYSYQYVAMDVEHFVGPVDLPGGRYGSWALATLPCDAAGLIVPRVPGAVGVGSGALAAHRARGTPGVPVIREGIGCDSGMPWAELGVDSGAVTWRLDGEVTGWTVNPNRLLVLSMPRP